MKQLIVIVCFYASSLGQHPQSALTWLTVCMNFIPSLLLFADVLTFCSEKESLFVTLESFKEREAIRPLPDSPRSQFSEQNNRSLSSMQRLLPICRAPPTRVPCTVLLILLLFIVLVVYYVISTANVTVRIRVHTII